MRRPNDTTSGDFMKYTVAAMAEAGPQILKELREAVGGRQHLKGEALGGLLELAARMERAMLERNPAEFSRAAIAVLFLARDIAILDGVIKVEAIAPQA